MKETYYLPVAKLKLRRHDNGAIFMHLDGQSVELAQLKRALPLSNPDEFIVLYDVDSTELGIIRHLAELDEGSRQVLQEALQKTYRIEQITRILEVERDTLTGQVRWRVEIDATPPSFESDAAPALPSTIPANEQAAPKTQASATPTTEADGETIAEPEQHRETNGVNGKAPHDEEKSPGKVKWFRHRDKDRETSEGDDTTNIGGRARIFD